MQSDFKKLEEHIEISKLILDGVKASNELYKQSIDILKNLEGMGGEETKKSSLADIMKSLDDEEEDEEE